MNVVSGFMEQDVADCDLAKQLDPVTSGSLQTQKNLVHTKFDIGQGIVPTRMIATKNSKLVDLSFP